MKGFLTLLEKELRRFWKVSVQTVAAPVLTALLYLLIFSHVLEDHVEVYPGVSYAAFLIPGLVIMTMLQNAFANSASSLIQSKMSGNIVFVLLTPITYRQFFLAYTLASVIRAIAVGAGVWLVGLYFVAVAPAEPLWLILFALLGAALAANIGMLAGIWSENWDQMAAFQNFVIMPLTFLSGVFYSIHSLPEFWQRVSWFNPFFYMIDGFRYGFLGVADVDPWLSLAIVGGCGLALSLATLALLKSGYKLRH